MDLWWLEQTTAGVPASNLWLSPAESRRLAHWRFAPRRAAWRLGRWTAKLAVAFYFGWAADLETLAGIEIATAQDGSPETSLPVSLSLTHRDGRAACAITAAGVRLGCDLEIVEPHAETFAADYFTSEEQICLANAPPRDHQRLVALTWSAKESALKAMRVGLRADTRSVEISFDAGCCAEWHRFQARCPGGLRFDGWWQQAGPWLRTLAGEHLYESAPRNPACSSALNARLPLV